MHQAKLKSGFTLNIYIYIKTTVPDLFLMVSNHLDVVKVLKYIYQIFLSHFGVETGP